MDTVKFDRGAGAVRMVAHRGLSGIETENTCAAFVAAGNRSYFGVETDVHVSADGQFIIHHDDSTLRVGGEDRIIEQTDAATLRAMTLTDRATGEKTRADLKIPVLSEYIAVCKKYDKTCVLELKNHMEPAAVAGIVDVIRGLEWLERTVFISFDHANMVELRRLLPSAKLQFLTGDAPDAALLEKLKPWGLDLDIYHGSLTKEGLDLMHAHGIEVNCWTVDDAADAQRLAAWGVDYITSNILE